MEKINFTKSELLLLIESIFKDGLKESNKIVRKCTPTSGAIYLPKWMIGKTYDIYFVPKDQSANVAEEVKKAEEKFKEIAPESEIKEITEGN